MFPWIVQAIFDKLEVAVPLGWRPFALASRDDHLGGCRGTGPLEDEGPDLLRARSRPGPELLRTLRYFLTSSVKGALGPEKTSTTKT
jgi:hypothetical protein